MLMELVLTQVFFLGSLRPVGAERLDSVGGDHKCLELWFGVDRVGPQRGSG